MKRVLVVDDSPSVRRMVRQALDGDYEVLEAKDGLSACMMAAAGPAPDVIISDVEMPRLNGISMAKRLGASPRTASIPIIFLTRRDRPCDVSHGMKVGARLYLTKPFQPGELRAKVASLLQSPATATAGRDAD